MSERGRILVMTTPESSYDTWFDTEHGIEAPPITSEDFDDILADDYSEESFGVVEDPPEFGIETD